MRSRTATLNATWAVAAACLLLLAAWGADSEGPARLPDAPESLTLTPLQRSGHFGGALAAGTGSEPPREELPGSPLASQATTLEVTVLWSDHEQPADHVGVSVTFFGGPTQSTRTSHTDATGVAHFDRCIPGTAIIELDRREGSESVRLLSGHRNAVSLLLDSEKNLRGIVVDAQGTPVADAGILLSRTSNWSSGSEICRSGPDGTFSIPGVTGPRYISARSENHAPSWPREVDSDSPDSVRITLTDPGHAVCGTVRNTTDDQPVTNAFIRLEPPFGQSPPAGPQGGSLAPRLPWTTRSHQDGRFELRGIPAGRGVLRVRADGFASRSLAYHATADGQAVEIFLSRGPVVSGSVRDYLGEPVAGALVALGPESAAYPGGSSFDPFLCQQGLTDGEGRFRFEHAPTQQTPLLASAQSVIVRRMLDPRRESTEAILLTLPAPKTARLTVRLCLTDGSPLRDARIEAGPGTPTETWGLRASTDVEGLATLHPVPPGALRITATLPATSPFPIAIREIEASQRGEVELRVRPERLQTGSLAMRVVQALSGHPIEGARVSLNCGFLGRSNPGTSTDDQGFARFTRLPCDVYTLVVHAEGGTPTRVEGVRILPGQPTDLGAVEIDR